MTRIITIQPEAVTDNVWATDDGRIVEGKRLPYPFHVRAEDGRVERQDFWQGDPYSVIGFQNRVDVQHVDLWWAEAAADPNKIVGKFPVMTERDGGPYTYTVAIESVSVREERAR